jgi:hypothetical protein
VTASNCRSADGSLGAAEACPDEFVDDDLNCARSVSVRLHEKRERPLQDLQFRFLNLVSGQCHRNKVERELQAAVCALAALVELTFGRTVSAFSSLLVKKSGGLVGSFRPDNGLQRHDDRAPAGRDVSSMPRSSARFSAGAPGVCGVARRLRRHDLPRTMRFEDDPQARASGAREALQRVCGRTHLAALDARNVGL